MIRVADIVTSKQGHDEGRLYVVVATLNDDFCLVCDGHYRKLDKPKTKRAKHVGYLSHSQSIEELLSKSKLSDANIICELKKARVDKPPR